VITSPHKFAALRHCDEASDRARFLGAANVLRRIAADRWHGDMTDGAAMVAALRRAGCEPGGRRALVIGAGGAGSAVALAPIEARGAAPSGAGGGPKRCHRPGKRLAATATAVAQAGTAQPAPLAPA